MTFTYLFGCADGNFKTVLKIIKRHNRTFEREIQSVYPSVGGNITIETIVFANDGLWWMVCHNDSGSDLSDIFFRKQITSVGLYGTVFFSAKDEKPGWFENDRSFRLEWEESDGEEVLSEFFCRPQLTDGDRRAFEHLFRSPLKF